MGVSRLSLILAVELILTFLVPPVGWHGRSIYAGDLWFFLWVELGLVVLLLKLPAEARKKLLIGLVASAAVIAIAYAHGFLRPLRIAGLPWTEESMKDSVFSAGREAVVAFRFLQWLWGGVLLAAACRQLSGTERSELVKRVARWGAGVLVVSALLVFAAKVSPGGQALLGRIYGYNPYVPGWLGRAYGTFRSPNETGMAFAFGTLLILCAPIIEVPLRWVCLSFSIAALLLTHCATAILSLLICIGFLAVSRLPVRAEIKRGFFASCGLAGIAVFVAALILAPFYGKLGTFHGRIEPWLVYLKLGTSRLDYLLFGVGFSSLSVDNFYIYLFNRGGLLFFGAAAVGVAVFVRRLTRGPFLRSQAILLFLLVCSLGLDAIIYRPMIALGICLAIPLCSLEITP